jgi:hypothetical protein
MLETLVSYQVQSQLSTSRVLKQNKKHMLWNWPETCAEIAYRGDVEALKYFYSKCHKTVTTPSLFWDERTCGEAALAGNREVIQWARTKKCPWNSVTMSKAAIRGNIGLMQWLREQGCPWDARTCEEAALSKNLNILKWARKNGCEWDSRTCEAAAFQFEAENDKEKTRKRVELLAWLNERDCPCKRKYH